MAPLILFTIWGLLGWALIARAGVRLADPEDD